MYSSCLQDRSHCHGSSRPQRDEQRNGVMTGEALAPRPLRSHPHAVPRAASRRRPSSLQHSSHRDGLQDSQVHMFDRKPEHGSSNKRCHPDSAAPDDCGIDVGGRCGEQASMCTAGEQACSAGCRCVVLLVFVGGLTVLACACAFNGFLLNFLPVSTGLPLRFFVTHIHVHGRFGAACCGCHA